ncbi:MAG TPA: hypothetical protein VJB92_02200 [Candidatus Paceibacterota bacterium]
MKIIVAALTIIVVLVVYFWLFKKPATAPTQEFRGPTSAPYVNGPTKPPPN